VDSSGWPWGRASSCSQTGIQIYQWTAPALVYWATASPVDTYTTMSGRLKFFLQLFLAKCSVFHQFVRSNPCAVVVIRCKLRAKLGHKRGELAGRDTSPSTSPSKPAVETRSPAARCL